VDLDELVTKLDEYVEALMKQEGEQERRIEVKQSLSKVSFMEHRRELVCMERIWVQSQTDCPMELDEHDQASASEAWIIFLDTLLTVGVLQ
ncbi:unnamed protein product, partial [Polarella glacialis]